MFESGVYAHRSRLFRHIQQGTLNEEVVHELLPNGSALLVEKALWDYKRELPLLAADRQPSPEEKDLYAARMAAIVKDSVSFYNSYGGYIVAGVDDRTRAIVGFDNHFSVEDLQKKIYAATGHRIDCHFALCDAKCADTPKKAGILFIPRRPYSVPPVQFRRNAPKNPSTGSMAYKEGDIYLRIGDECRPAHSAEDYSFLCGEGRRETSVVDEFRRSPILLNNLGSKDPGFIKFVGRESYLRELWFWVCDGFTPVKLLTGIGGVGKTTLAREFAEDFIRNPPNGLTKLIWLTAKRKLYTAVRGVFQATSRVDFSDTNTLLRAILCELGSPAQLLDPEMTVQELVEECVGALELFPALLIVDDVDSLDPVQQQEVFQTMIQIATRTIGRWTSPSLVLLTSRLDLGASPRQLLHIAGLDESDFVAYCKLTAESIGMPFTLKEGTQLLHRFHKMTDGSPTFAASILRLMNNGQHLESVLKEWKGADGDEVRRFAFGRELDQLSDSQIRTLYAACLLGDTSFVELQGILESNDRLLNDDLGALRRYHLITLGEDLPGGARIIIPSSLTLVTDLIAKRIADPRKLARLCARAQRGTASVPPDVGEAIRRVAALWREGKPEDALQSAEVAASQYPDHADIECLLGRAYLNLNPPDAVQAERHLKRAQKLECARPELPDLWIKAKVLREDWVGLLDGESLFGDIPATIIAHATAYFELGMIAVRARNIERALTQWRMGFRELSKAMTHSQLRGREQEGRQLQRSLAENVLRATESLTKFDSDKLSVWMVGIDAINVGVKSYEAIALSCNAILAWWRAVEARRKYDPRAFQVVGDQVKRIDRALARMSNEFGLDGSVLSLLATTKEELLKRSRAYLERDYSDE